MADCLQYAAPAFTTGAVCVTALRWLVELRSKLAKDGPGSFRSRVLLSIQRSRQQQQHHSNTQLPFGRSGSAPLPDTPAPGRLNGSPSASNAIAQDALLSMLAGANSPFLIQIVEGAVVIEAVSAAAVGWLRTPEASELVFMAQVTRRAAKQFACRS